jgi:hypothetical protein
MEKKTERSNCHFAVERSTDGKPILVVQLYQDGAISSLREMVLGFDLLGGTQLEQASKLAEMLNERVLDCFVTMKNKSGDVG